MIANSSYTVSAQRWHAYLIYTLVLFLFTVINVYGSKIMHSMNMAGENVYPVLYLKMLKLFQALAYTSSDML